MQRCELLGCGSTRFAVASGDKAAAKLAHTVLGLAHNLNEAAFWLGFPERLRHHLAPCMWLTPQLVLLQERVQSIGPPLHESVARDTTAERDEATKAFGTRIAENRLACGLGTEVLRLDNHGLTLDGRLVSIDYAEKWRPLEHAWAWLLGRLDQGQSVRLDDAEREQFFGHLVVTGECVYPERPTFRLLAERAGVRVGPADPCLCRSGEPFATCPDRDAHGYELGALECERERALINTKRAPVTLHEWLRRAPGGRRVGLGRRELIEERLLALAGL